jgi:ubiquinone/menaquinone biosynthesis C-methylase UbiE
MIWTILILIAIFCFSIAWPTLFSENKLDKRIVYWLYDNFGFIFFSSDTTQQWQKLLKILNLKGNETILEIGTATGGLSLTIASQPGFYGHVTGIDWSPQMIEKAQKSALKLKIEQLTSFNVTDVSEFVPFDNESFDIVLCVGVLELLKKPEDLFTEIDRVLKPEGVLVVSLYQEWYSGKTINLSWFKEKLMSIGLSELQIIPCRISHDLIIAWHPSFSTKN